MRAPVQNTGVDDLSVSRLPRPSLLAPPSSPAVRFWAERRPWSQALLHFLCPAHFLDRLTFSRCENSCLNIEEKAQTSGFFSCGNVHVTWSLLSVTFSTRVRSAVIVTSQDKATPDSSRLPCPWHSLTYFLPQGSCLFWTH